MSDAYDDGCLDTVCTDYEASVVETMQKRNAEKRPGIKYMQVDARDMHMFEDRSFDVVFEKSTMDALKCAGRPSMRRASGEIHRVLKDAGWYFCISLHGPEDLVPNLKDTGYVSRQWDVQVNELEANDDEEDVRNGRPHQTLHLYVSRKVPFRAR